MHTMEGGGAAKLASGSVTSLTCIGLYGASAGYDGARGRAKRFLERLDHGAIFLVIAGPSRRLQCS